LQFLKKLTFLLLTDIEQMPVPTSGFGKAVDKRASEMYFENAQVLATADSSILALGRSQGTG
jgi:hypothetical protein